MSPQDDVSDPAELGRSFQQMLESQPPREDVDQPPAGEAESADSPPPLMRIVEALLFVGGAPLTLELTADIIRGLTKEQFDSALDALNQNYRRQGRPYSIGQQGEGFALLLKPRYRAVQEKLYGATKEARLSTVAVDVLSLVAYRQPATKAEIDSLRGSESGALLRQLVRRGLVSVVRRADAQEREVSYGTTPRFLELFGLSSLDDLPRTQDLEQL